MSITVKNNHGIFAVLMFKEYKMKTMQDYPMADISPYEGSLNRRLNECTTQRVLSFGNARVELERYQRNITAKMALTQKVDRETFVKVFRESLQYIAKLSRTAQAVLWYIMDNLPKDKGYVIVDNSTVMDYCCFKTRKSVRDAILELLEKNILTKSTIHKKYWINPLIIFNGNRITYAQEYILDEADLD